MHEGHRGHECCDGHEVLLDRCDHHCVLMIHSFEGALVQDRYPCRDNKSKSKSKSRSESRSESASELLDSLGSLDSLDFLIASLTGDGGGSGGGRRAAVGGWRFEAV